MPSPTECVSATFMAEVFNMKLKDLDLRVVSNEQEQLLLNKNGTFWVQLLKL